MVLVVVVPGSYRPETDLFVEVRIKLTLLKVALSSILMATPLLPKANRALVEWGDVRSPRAPTGKECRVKTVKTLVLIVLAVFKIVMPNFPDMVPFFQNPSN